MAKYIDADTVVGLRFFDETCGIEKTIIETDTIENILDNFTEEGCPEPTDVVSKNEIAVLLDEIVKELTSRRKNTIADSFIVSVIGIVKCKIVQMGEKTDG